MPRAKSKRPHEPKHEPREITVWPSAPPDELGSIAPPGLSLDYEDLGSRFLSEATEQSYSEEPSWHEESDEAALLERLGPHLVRAFLQSHPPDDGAGARAAVRLPRERLPREYEEYLVESGEVDLTSENIREASLLDHEGAEPGETESPFVRTDDTHTHALRRGGHAPQRVARPRR